MPGTGKGRNARLRTDAQAGNRVYAARHGRDRTLGSSFGTKCANPWHWATHHLLPKGINIHVEQRLRRLKEKAAEARAEMKAIAEKVKREGRAELTSGEDARFRAIAATLSDLNDQADQLRDEIIRSGRLDRDALAVSRATSGGGGWAARAATALQKMTGEARAVTSGSVNVPSLIDPAVTPKSRPTRLVDLLVNRAPVQANNFDYWRQTTRTNAAAPVADLAVKPTSTYTLTAVEDRCRVLAHLSEEVPIRLWQDNTEVIRWLESEMVAGVYDALEAQVISGDGTGENLSGVLDIAGTTAVAFATDVPTTLRKALTALTAIGVTPNAWAINQADAEALDLLKEGTGGIGYLLDGYVNGVADSANVLGPNTIQRVVSPSVPAGVAILGDWSQIKLFVREDMRLDIDAGGELFTKNAAIMRAEMRIGLGHLHPASMAICDLTA